MYVLIHTFQYNTQHFITPATNTHIRARTMFCIPLHFAFRSISSILGLFHTKFDLARTRYKSSDNHGQLLELGARVCVCVCICEMEQCFLKRNKIKTNYARFRSQ